MTRSPHGALLQALALLRAGSKAALKASEASARVAKAAEREADVLLHKHLEDYLPPTKTGDKAKAGGGGRKQSHAGKKGSKR